MTNMPDMGRRGLEASPGRARAAFDLLESMTGSRPRRSKAADEGRRPAVTPGFDHDKLGGTFRVALIVGHSHSFGAYAMALATALSGLGADVTVHGPNDAVPAGEVAILIGLHRFTRDRVRALRRTCTVVAVQTEQLMSAMQGAPSFGALRLPKILPLLPYVDLVIEWSRENARVLGTQHPRVAVVPFGLIESDLYPSLPTVTPLYDLAFIGHVDALNGRRRRILEQLAVTFTVHPMTSGAWGADKFAVFSEARIVLNLHVEASAVFESPRFFDVMGARRPLVSEPVHDPWPFLPGRDFQETTVLDLERQVARLLEDAPLRERLAASGRVTAETNSMGVSAAMFLRLLLVAHHG